MSKDVTCDVYGVIIGGVTVVKNGKVIASAAAAAVYTEMDYKHVQGIWKTLNANHELGAALTNVSGVAAPILTQLGDKYGLVTGKMTQVELDQVNKAAKA